MAYKDEDITAKDENTDEEEEREALDIKLSNLRAKMDSIVSGKKSRKPKTQLSNKSPSDRKESTLSQSATSLKYIERSPTPELKIYIGDENVDSASQKTCQPSAPTTPSKLITGGNYASIDPDSPVFRSPSPSPSKKTLKWVDLKQSDFLSKKRSAKTSGLENTTPTSTAIRSAKKSGLEDTSPTATAIRSSKKSGLEDTSPTTTAIRLSRSRVPEDSSPLRRSSRLRSASRNSVAENSQAEIDNSNIEGENEAPRTPKKRPLRLASKSKLEPEVLQEDQERTAEELMPSPSKARKRDTAPTTPKKRVRVGPRTPTKLMTKEALLKSPRKTPVKRNVTINPYFSAPVKGILRTPSTPTVFSMAKSLFQRGANSGIIGREKERKEISDFLQGKMNKNENGALYLTGVPGTGKSALFEEVLNEEMKKWKGKFNVRYADINCMSAESPSDIFLRIYEEIVEDADITENYEDRSKQPLYNGITGQVLSYLENRFLKHPELRHIILLDELDQIMGRDQEIIYTIFQWAFAANSNLVVVGIANALDLTDRFLPKLRSLLLTPHHIQFQPYSAAEIQSVIEQRLWSLVGGPSAIATELPLMQSNAVQFIARKTASNTGDMRKAFDLSRKCIEMVEEEYRRRGAGTVQTLLTCVGAPRVTLPLAVRTCSLAFGSNLKSRIQPLNFHQKAAMCVLVQFEKPTTTEVYDKYRMICMRDKAITPLSYNEFLEVLSVLESNGLIRYDSRRRLCCDVGKLDIMTIMSEIQLLKIFLRD